MSTPVQPLSSSAIGTTIGGHQLDRLMYDGGDGRQVFLTSDVSDDRRPAVMKLAPLPDEPGVTRLSREFAILRQLAGSGVVTALGYGVTLRNRSEYLVLAAHGPSLAAVLAAAPEGRLETSAALAMGYSIAMSLAQLHDRGWCHGDLKPGNILCDRTGTVHLTDLEFAVRFRDPDQENGRELRQGGTPPFMAPELWSVGSDAKSPATDVWSLGVTLYLALFGEYSFGDGSTQSIHDAIDEGLPARLNDVPQPIRRLFQQLLASDPADRCPDGTASGAAIARAAADLGIDLEAGTQAFARVVAAVPAEFAASSGSSTLVPQSLQPRTEVGAPESAHPPTEGPPASAIPPLPNRPPGVGAASKPGQDAFLRRLMQLDIASMAAPGPGSTPQPSPATTAPAPSEPKTMPMPAACPAAPAEKESLTRRAAARWYRRMNPDRNFPLSVVISGKQMRIIGGSGLGITLGTKELVLDADEPVLNIEPWFPGCLVSPPQADVHCTPETTVCRFWVTPLVCGDLAEACITIRYRGQVVETLATPSKVVTRTTAKVLAAMGLVSPVVGKALQISGWKADEFLHQTLPYLGHVLARVGMLEAVLLLTGALLVAAVGYYHVTRPLLSDAEPNLFPAT